MKRKNLLLNKISNKIEKNISSKILFSNKIILGDTMNNTKIVGDLTNVKSMIDNIISDINPTQDAPQTEVYRRITFERSSNQQIADSAKLALQNPLDCVWFALDVIGGPWAKAEPVILQDPGACLEYARMVLDKRWPEGEKTILASRNMNIILVYFMDLLNSGERWREAEPLILTDPEITWEYISIILDGPWSEAEEILLTSPIHLRAYTELLRESWGKLTRSEKNSIHPKIKELI